MTLDEWDLKVSPVLRELYSRANHMYVQAMRLEVELRYLASRPSFMTNFEEEVEITIAKLEEILKQYREKPINA